jgi:hypothetical protein
LAARARVPPGPDDKAEGKEGARMVGTNRLSKRNLTILQHIPIRALTVRVSDSSAIVVEMTLFE